ncbi:DUF885 domain-containing protein [Paraneptunicella aestuarii]|uniref:DUF885 domain-containing protein n=1 Tax=Paraneptunicella aestuarii TaxID=2831148 RepID=UPI001E2B5B83|nr:DUF885 domain-containing protein [Paraneptunicella aestuarii]UAA38837.1 DUF885 domain-containing protein [Paraneptunicella aestuarii]
MKQLLLCIFAILTLPAYATPAQELSELLDEIYQYEMQVVHPIEATIRGFEASNNKLPDASEETLESYNKQFKVFLERLHRIDFKALSRTEQINYQVQEYYLLDYIDEYEIGGNMLPFTSESGFFSSLSFLPSIHQFKTEKDYQDYLSRLSQFPEYFEQQIHWLKKGIATGMTQPKAILDGLPETVANFYQMEPEKSGYYRPFTQFSNAKLSSEQQKALQDKARDIIQNKVFPSYQTLHTFLLEEYIPKAKTDISAHAWKNGKAYYQNRVSHYTTTKMTAEEIHQLGLQEVKRIRGEMQKVIEDVKFDGDLKAFIHFLRTDPQFYAKSEQELMRYAAYLSKKIDSKLPKLFSHLPRTPYGVEPVPASIAPKYTTGRYIQPNNDSEPGYYWVNTYALNERPLYALPALTLHEAVPGHHLQIALAMELEELPPVRRFGYISAFGEGWGLYSEYLGKEINFYETPYDEFGRLSYEMWRAARLVVDTGMHSQGWSRQRAIDFMLENTALSKLNIISEIDRYISWPAQALSYKIGELTIKKLRKQAEQELGDKFDVREFHKAVLEHGAIPLSILEENINLYIQKNK